MVTALNAPKANAWLDVFPNNNLGSQLNDQVFHCVIGLRLGCKLFLEHKCLCGHMVDSKGTHNLSCTKSSGRLSRHQEINDILKRGLTSVGIPCRLESMDLSRSDGKRVDGVSLIPCLVLSI